MCTRFGHIYLLETGLGELDWLNTTVSAEASCSLVDSTESCGGWWILCFLTSVRGPNVQKCAGVCAQCRHIGNQFRRMGLAKIALSQQQPAVA